METLVQQVVRAHAGALPVRSVVVMSGYDSESAFIEALGLLAPAGTTWGLVLASVVVRWPHGGITYLANGPKALRQVLGLCPSVDVLLMDGRSRLMSVMREAVAAFVWPAQEAA